jgi:outer membrane usher protein
VHNRRPDGTYGLYDVSARGAVAYVGGTVGLSRPIEDSFAVARIEPPVAGVRVYLNQQESGRTDASGRVFLPRVVSYVENHVGIDDRDVPIERALDVKGLTLVPFSRSGTVLTFQAPQTRAITGTLTYRRGGRVLPLELVLVTIDVGGKAIEVPTGRGGEFYFENVPAGDYPARVQVPGRDCAFTLSIPGSDETLVRLPEVSACDVP